MQEVTNIGLDISKSVFQVQGVDAEGQVVLRPQLGPVSCHILESCLRAWSICPGRAGPVLASLVPVLWKAGVGSDVMKPIAAPIVGGMNTSTINVLFWSRLLYDDEGSCAAAGEAPESRRSRCLRIRDAHVERRAAHRVSGLRAALIRRAIRLEIIEGAPAIGAGVCGSGQPDAGGLRA
jgi:hypothetical protein